MRLLFRVMNVVLVAGTARAEVCDKIAGEMWRPEDGPIDVWTAADAGKLVAFVCATWILAFAFRSRRIALVAALPLLMFAGIAGMAWLWPDEGSVWLAAEREGCVGSASSLTSVGIWTSAAIACWALPRVWMARHA